MDAAHGNFYVCGYAADGTVDMPPAFMSGEKAAETGRPIYGFENLNLPRYTRLNETECLYPAVVKSAEKGGGSLSALYVKRPQAEEERLSRLKKI